MQKAISLILTLILISGCIGKVQWTKRAGGNPVEETWVPTCPYCKHVVNYGNLQCPNPDCRYFLTWEDKKLLYDFSQVVEKEGESEDPVQQQEISIEPQGQPPSPEPQPQSGPISSDKSEDAVEATSPKVDDSGDKEGSGDGYDKDFEDLDWGAE